MELRQIYKQLTAIDISEQMQIWDERGKGYYGEYLLFCELYKHIIGQGKILMNLKIPVDDKKMTEIDLLLIHETGFYVFEIKHYKGTIYGKDKDHTWTQYFRTSKNKTFVNPIEQNGYHIRALRAMFPDIPVHSFIVFTNDECDIKVENSNSEIDVCLLRQVKNKLTLRFQAFDKKLTMETMDQFFTRLSVYSQMSEKVKIGVSEAPFYAWVQPILDKLEDEIAKLEEAEANRREFAEINRRKLIEELELEKYKIEQEKKKIEQDWKKSSIIECR